MSQSTARCTWRQTHGWSKSRGNHEDMHLVWTNDGRPSVLKGRLLALSTAESGLRTGRSPSLFRHLPGTSGSSPPRYLRTIIQRLLSSVLCFPPPLQLLRLARLRRLVPLRTCRASFAKPAKSELLERPCLVLTAARDIKSATQLRIMIRNGGTSWPGTRYPF